MNAFIRTLLALATAFALGHAAHAAAATEGGTGTGARSGASGTVLDRALPRIIRCIGC